MNKLPLIANVHRAIKSNSGQLCSLLKVSQSQILPKFDESYNDTIKIRNERIKLLKPLGAKTHINLLKLLYPTNKGAFSSITRPSRIDSQLLYEEYTKHDLRSIEPKHLNLIIENILDVPNFKRPVSILSKSPSPQYTTMHGYSKQRIYRNEALERIERLFKDLNKNKLPISIAEQNQFLYYTFFKDEPEILEKVAEAFRKSELPYVKSHNQFTTEFYQRLKLTDTNSLNNLLRICAMQNNREIFDDIIKKITPNRDTFGILLDDRIKRNDRAGFYGVIDSIDVCWDTLILNKVIKGYVHFKDDSNLSNCLDKLTTDDDLVYQQLNNEDRNEYHKFLHYYDELSKIIPMDEIQLVPNISTFDPLIDRSVAANKFKDTLKHCETIMSFNLPISTKIFKKIFSGKLTKRQTIKMLGILVDQYESNFIFDNDVNPKPNLHTGEMVKLPDNLMLKIRRQFRQPAIKYRFKLLREHIRSVRRHNARDDLYIINQVNYAKYDFLKKLYTELLFEQSS